MGDIYRRTHEELLRTLLDIATDLTVLRDQEAVLQIIVRRTRRLIGSDMAYISLTDFDRELTSITQTDGVFTPEYRGLVQPLGTGVLGQVAIGFAPYQTSDYLHDDELNRLPEIDEVVRREGVESIMGVPLRVGGRVIGALAVADRKYRVYDPDEIDLVDSVGKQAAIAIDNARRFDRITELTESLTGEQKRSAEELSIIGRMLDLDARLIEAVMVEPSVSKLLDFGRWAIGTDLWFKSPYGDLLGSPHTPGDAKPHLRDSVPVTAAGQHLGDLLAAREVDESDRGLMERVALHIALALLFRRAEKDADLRRQSAALEDLIQGKPDAVERAVPLLQRWGISVEDELWSVILAIPPQERRVIRQDVQSLLPSTLTMIHDDHLCVVTADAEWHIRLRKLFVQQGWRFRGGVSGPVRHPRLLADAHRSAEVALSSLMTTDTDGIIDAAELGVVGMVLDLARREGLPQGLTAPISPLLIYDRERGTELTHTALISLESDSSVSRAASLLGVHINTVRQRLARIAHLIGEGWDRSPRRLEIHLALHANRAQALQSSNQK